MLTLLTFLHYRYNITRTRSKSDLWIREDYKESYLHALPVALIADGILLIYLMLSVYSHYFPA